MTLSRNSAVKAEPPKQLEPWFAASLGGPLGKAIIDVVLRGPHVGLLRIAALGRLYASSPGGVRWNREVVYNLLPCAGFI